MRAKEEKAHVVTLRVSANEHAAIHEAAAKVGMSPSAFMRSTVLEGAGVKPFLTENDRLIFALILEDLRKVGVNLNQISVAINSKKYPVPEEVALHQMNVLKSHAAIFHEVKRLHEKTGHRLQPKY
ncbi:plasmid mobilization protein [Pseudochrobactrum asaccharolyticum]|uniref:Mobilization protein MobC n=1 Tax=Pseudochrobactrum asaccharolyticum TaxID=354351 RepID=A0A366DCB7_9HYPH|nr:plasmid mobilization relaxosome protein MobC [Pseudochrobactrum asaccharolyticum]RBO87700.1 mobilization protein MobC [Pseudochrobactrum asaccharolyticum]